MDNWEDEVDEQSNLFEEYDESVGGSLLEALDGVVTTLRQEVAHLAEEAAAEAAQRALSHDAAAAAARADSGQAEDQFRRSEVIAEMRRARRGW